MLFGDNSVITGSAQSRLTVTTHAVEPPPFALFFVNRVSFAYPDEFNLVSHDAIENPVNIEAHPVTLGMFEVLEANGVLHDFLDGLLEPGLNRAIELFRVAPELISIVKLVHALTF